MALELTWLTSPNNAIVYDTVAHQSANLTWATAIGPCSSSGVGFVNTGWTFGPSTVTNPAGTWQIYGTSDTVTSGLDGPGNGGATNRWGVSYSNVATGNAGAIVSAAAGTAHSWAIIKSPTTLGANGVAYYLNIDFTQAPASYFLSKAAPAAVSTSGTSNGTTTVTIANTTGILVGQVVTGTGQPGGTTTVTVVTPNTSVTLSQAWGNSATQTFTFAGGTKSRYTATDEVQLGTMTLPSTTSPCFSHISLSSNGDFIIMFNVTGGANTPRMQCAVHVTGLKDTKTSDTFPVMGGCWTIPNLVAPTTNPIIESSTSGALGYSGSTVYAGRNFANAANVNYTFLVYAYVGTGFLGEIFSNGSGQGVVAAGPLPGNGLAGADASDGKIDDLPVYVVANTAGNVSLRGRVADFRWGPCSTSPLTISPGSTPYNAIVIGSAGLNLGPAVWVPWVTSTPIIQ